ncbi:Retrovirus-related Pol polyprotein from transposon [Cucumispora dikerogammari]|nr:Retrovirus-related Pol polyprotein from transposon [Cucumispora dikerogammari]
MRPGSVLRHKGHSVAYVSRLLKKAEKNYTIIEKISLAALWSIKKFEFLLSGKKFNLITDYKALEQIKNKHNFGTPRIIRWLNRFNNKNFKVIYRESDKMQIPDALSRAAIEEKLNFENKNKDYNKLVLDLHKKLHHRKNIESALKDKRINFPKEKLRVILKKC